MLNTVQNYLGVLLAEIARVSPPGMAGVITGGAVFFAYAGMIVMPAWFELILEVSHSCRLAFVIPGTVSIGVGTIFFVVCTPNIDLRMHGLEKFYWDKFSSPV